MAIYPIPGVIKFCRRRSLSGYYVSGYYVSLISLLLLLILWLNWPSRHGDLHTPAVLIFNSSLLWRQQPTVLPSSAEMQHKVPNLRCGYAELDPYDPAVMQFHKKVPPVDCSSAMKDWVHVINGTFHISRDAVRHYGYITCDYAPVQRDGDFKVTYGSHVKPMLDGTRIVSDFFRVDCVSDSGKTYSNIHSAVARKDAVLNRLRRYHSAAKSATFFNSQSQTKMPADQKRTSPHLFHNLSIFILGYDSLSHMAWLRLLPKTHKYFTETLGGIVLEAYNILGDGTPAALLPILTGKLEEELPEARRGYKGAKPVDNHPWIWREFSKNGYVTGYAEDAPGVGTFHYRMLGFHDPPTDHFMRPFFLAAETADLNHPPRCYGSTPRHINFMKWFGSLFDMYADFPKFFFGFSSDVSHDSNNPAQIIDDDLVAFLQELERKDHLNSTLLILMADHGARYNFVRATAQGILEERLPYFSFRFPPWFHKLHPDIIRNIRTNARRLTTPYDIHATFLDILNYTHTDGEDLLRNRAISLFKEVPKERTCAHADVTLHWCACLEWKSINQSEPLVQQAVATAIKTINSYTLSHRSQCAELTLQKITQSLRFVPSSDRLSTEENVKQRLASRASYRVSFITLPGSGHFEVTCKFDVTSGTFSVGDRDISRINKYGSQPACIQNARPFLRPYCYCL